MDLTDINEVKTLLKNQATKAKKSLGQNFLINRDILRRILQTANLSKKDIIVEVGPGLGVLTRELCKKTKKVISVEFDSRIIPILKKNLKDEKNLKIINKNALDFKPPKNYKFVANIPYYITSPLINHFLQRKNKPNSLTLLVQYEVAQKICKKEPDMSILSLQIGLYAQTKLISKVKAGNFYPRPKVDSAIIHIKPYRETDPSYTAKKDAEKILRLAKKAFSQKRKKLSNTLSELKNTFLAKKLDLNRRPETLSIQEWQNIVKYIRLKAKK